MAVDFIGIGAQKAGTSWVYTCWYEHPEVCAPVKELHFFSRPRYRQGMEWYERHFVSCRPEQKRGEFSTSYLASLEAPARIKECYPDVRLIAILRNPVDRAYSQYRNAIKAGEIEPSESFSHYVATEQSCLAQGRYYAQISRYLSAFPREQVLILIYEDSYHDPATFMSRIYQHLGVDATFTAPALTTKVNPARVYRHPGFAQGMHRAAEGLRRLGLDRLVYGLKQTGLTEWVHRRNTSTEPAPEAPDLARYREYFREDVSKLSKLLNRDLHSFWQL